ncbi:hypothetical protein [Aliiroseovarius sp. S253]|uniref:hypothetical protein n=1 Tax=Aliiroseovarius sp. S253 TaxID=3415133 RepID=UPI003C7EB1DF
MVSDSSGYYSTDEFIECESAVKELTRALKAIPDDVFAWKWAILAAHNMLQNACICILTRTDGLGVFSNDGEKAMHNYLYGEKDGVRNRDDPNSERPNPRLADTRLLINRLPKSIGASMTKRNAKEIPFNEAGDLSRLHEFRNEFAHFSPQSWSLEISGLPRIIRAAVRISDAIIQSSDYQRHNRFDQETMAQLMAQVNELLDGIERG